MVDIDSFEGKDRLNKDYGDSTKGWVTTYGVINPSNRLQELLNYILPGLSKLANILHIKHLQKQLDSENIPITCMALNPGAVATPGVNTFFDSMGFIGRILKLVIVPLFFLSTSDGGMNSAFAAASEEITNNKTLYKGAYLMPVGKITQPSKAASNEQLAMELYNTTKDVLLELGV